MVGTRCCSSHDLGGVATPPYITDELWKMAVGANGLTVTLWNAAEVKWLTPIAIEPTKKASGFPDAFD
jgi:hypothetical protein